MIHPWDPVGFHGGLLLLGVLFAIALDLDDQAKEVLGTVAIIDQHNEIGTVTPCLRSPEIRNLEAEIVALRVGDDLRVTLRDAAELGFPFAIEYDPVDMVLRWRAVGLPAQLP